MPPPPPTPTRNESSLSPVRPPRERRKRKIWSPDCHGGCLRRRTLTRQFRRHTQFETLQRLFGARGKNVAGRTGHVHVTRTEKNSLSPRKTYSKGNADLYHIDLADVSSLATCNGGSIYLLTSLVRWRGRCPFEQRAVETLERFREDIDRRHTQYGSERQGKSF